MKLPTYLWDILAALGVLIVAGGMWTVHPAAGAAVVGGSLIWVGVVGAKTWK
jgi:hypothetical protein